MSQSQHPLLGVGLKLVSVFSLSSMAACVKYLGPSIPAGQVVFFRGIVSIAVVAAVASRTGGLRLLRTRNWRAHASRSLCGSLSMFCWFASLSLIPLAQMTTISFTIPLFLTVLALVFLGEHIRWYRWTALAIGFAGVIVIVSPDLVTPGGSALGVGIAMTAAVLAAFAQMFVRRMSAHEHALTITFWFFVTSTTLALATLAFGPWPWPTPTCAPGSARSPPKSPAKAGPCSSYRLSGSRWSRSSSNGEGLPSSACSTIPSSRSPRRS